MEWFPKLVILRKRNFVSRVLCSSFITNGTLIGPEFCCMNRPDHAVFRIECVAPCFHHVVEIRPHLMRLTVHPLLLLLAPSFRHRHVEGDRNLRWPGLHQETQLIAEGSVLEDARTLLPLVPLSHPRLCNRNDGEIKRHWESSSRASVQRHPACTSGHRLCVCVGFLLRLYGGTWMRRYLGCWQPPKQR